MATKTHWVRRNEITRETVGRIAKLLRLKTIEGSIMWLRDTTVLKDDDEKAEKFGFVIEDLIISAKAEHILKNRSAAIAKLDKDKTPAPHCDKCAKNPDRPITYWDHRRWIDEQSFLRYAAATENQLKGSIYRLTFALIMVTWGASLASISKSPEAQP